MKLKFIIDKRYDKRLVQDAKIRRQFSDIYKDSLKHIKGAASAYQKSWDKISKEFSDYIEKETSYKWFYPTYYCIVSAVHPGISNWGYEPKIVRWWRENSDSQRKITAHELILSHYFEIYRHHFSHYNLTDNQVWALAEIAAFALTSLTPKVKKFWPWDFSGYSYKHNYPQIIELQKKLKDKFLKRKSFDDYIKAGIILVKNYKI